jgi:hypothetical protein
LVQERVILKHVARNGGDRSIEFLVVVVKPWRKTGGGGRRCGVESPVLSDHFIRQCGVRRAIRDLEHPPVALLPFLRLLAQVEE